MRNIKLIVTVKTISKVTFYELFCHVPKAFGASFLKKDSRQAGMTGNVILPMNFIVKNLVYVC
jgi:hypothetical protein